MPDEMAPAERNLLGGGSVSMALQRLILALAVVLRLVAYFRKDSLWGDEAMLALNIASRSFHELLGPLAYAQVAPVPFLWAERLMTLLFGINEWALRALPLIAGIALCVLVVLIVQRMLRPDEALVALVLVGFSPSLLRYSAELKPYSLDALLGVAMVGVAAGVIDRPNSRKSWSLLAALGAITTLFSLASVFVSLGVGMALGGTPSCRNA